MTDRLNLLTRVVTGPSGRVGLSPQHMTMLVAVMVHRSLSSGDLADLVWPDPDVMPDFWIESLRVLRCQLNGKLRLAGCGWRVVSRQQQCRLIDRPMADGYRFPASDHSVSRLLARRHLGMAA